MVGGGGGAAKAVPSPHDSAAWNLAQFLHLVYTEFEVEVNCCYACPCSYPTLCVDIHKVAKLKVQSENLVEK